MIARTTSSRPGDPTANVARNIELSSCARAQQLLASGNAVMLTR